jgi:SAM-dependent methyltransferase
MEQLDCHFAAYYRWLTIQHLDIVIQDDTVLEVGCDDGYFLSRQAGKLKFGVDLRPRVPPGQDVFVVQADGCNLPFADASFSNMFAFDVIEHVPDDNAFIISLTRVLASNGRLWLSTPSDKSWYSWLPWLTRRAMESWDHQRMGYDVDDLVGRFPPGYHVQVTLWNASSFRFLYPLIRALVIIAEIGAPGHGSLF